jgi:uncharacterized protein (DUF488 family)
MGQIGVGVYGHNEESFLAALRAAHIETVIDIRRFRGLRGPKYRWANSSALQSLLKSAGLQYLHAIELSPTKELRAIQKLSDVRDGVSKAMRSELNTAFIAGYRSLVSPYLTNAYLDSLPKSAAFLCVERTDEACHRSVLLAMLREVADD